jgi:hypothetical protein
VWRRVFLAQQKQERSSVPMLRMEAQPQKEALPEGGSITILFSMPKFGVPKIVLTIARTIVHIAFAQVCIRICKEPCVFKININFRLTLS